MENGEIYIKLKDIDRIKNIVREVIKTKSISLTFFVEKSDFNRKFGTSVKIGDTESVMVLDSMNAALDKLAYHLNEVYESE